MRYITGMDIEEMMEWHPCGCSLTGYTCLMALFVFDVVNGIVDGITNAVEDTVEWIASWL